jgi:hypothetical protein
MPKSLCGRYRLEDRQGHRRKGADAQAFTIETTFHRGVVIESLANTCAVGLRRRLRLASTLLAHGTGEGPTARHSGPASSASAVIGTLLRATCRAGRHIGSEPLLLKPPPNRTSITRDTLTVGPRWTSLGLSSTASPVCALPARRGGGRVHRSYGACEAVLSENHRGCRVIGAPLSHLS